MTSILSINESNTSSLNRKETVNLHFRWASVYKFMVLVSVFGSLNLDCFDMFSKNGEITVSIFETLFFQLVVCAPYMFMDCFIKQYTRKMDGYSLMNPLLRGIQFGVFLQTAFVTILNSLNIADMWRYFGVGLKEVPNWNICHGDEGKCKSRMEIFYKCYYASKKTRTKLTSTSSHIYYMKMFRTLDRNTVTLKVFSGLMVWILNFFISTVADETFYKICRFTHLSRIISTLTAIIVVLITNRKKAFDSIGRIMSWEGEFHYDDALAVGTYAYSIGRLSFYDYEVLSPYTMTDNAVIFYLIQLNVEAMLRSWVFSTMVMSLKTCVIFDKPITSNHYYLFCVLPLSAECMPMTRVFVLYLFVQMLLGMTTQLSMMTVSMAKSLQAEFRSVKTNYFIGLLCFVGISITIPIAMYLVTRPKGFFRGLFSGLHLATMIVAFLKVFVIVVVYGIRRFSQDIHYWLGFKLTRYWELMWTLLPVTCMGALILTTEGTKKLVHPRSIYIVIFWVTLTLLLVTIINIRTIALHLINNVLGRAFVASVKYGPPDPEDRKKRRFFDETIELRRCRHQCHILDEEIDCNHMFMMTTLSLFSENSESLQDVTTKQHDSLVLDIENT